ncbi:MAG: signal peptide peptidase SppA, partial [Bacteroidota bacterium]
NSPGGLTLISDIIWKEVELAKKEKPLVVSFSSLAASAGYHISCPADSIVAEPLTLTGSIGVFAIIPNTQKFFDNKLGITFDRVTTGKYSDFISGVRPLSTFEKQILEKQVDTVYSRFINNVSSGRKMSVDDVDKIGQGRIWSGIQAKELGLVDELGGLNKAIQIAADLSEINNYRIVEYPEIRDPFEVFFESLYDDAAMGTFNSETKKLIEYYSKTLDLIKGKEVYSRLPFEIELY